MAKGVFADAIFDQPSRLNRPNPSPGHGLRTKPIKALKPWERDGWMSAAGFAVSASVNTGRSFETLRSIGRACRS